MSDDGWQNYSSYVDRLSLLLPPDWVVIDLSTPDYAGTITTLTERNQQIGSLFTPDYLQNLASSGIRFLSMEMDEEAIPSGTMTNLNLLAIYYPPEMAFEEYLVENQGQLRGIFGEDLEITQEEIEMAGLPGVKISYMIEANDYEGQMQVIECQQFMVLKGDTLFILTFSAANEVSADLAEEINIITNSFQFSTVLYASPDGTNPFCYSWEHACNLQTALAGSRAGDEIWVKAGIHTPAPDATSPATSFWLKNGVAVYGGFDGTEISRDQRDWVTNTTVLSGDIGGDDVTDFDGVVMDTDSIAGENSYHVVNASGTDASAILDGFIITAGFASETPPNINGFGGGMIMQAGSPTLTNIKFIGNTAGKGAGYYGGGGMYISFGSNPVLTHVSFIANTAGGGAGMYVDRGSNPVLNDVIFTLNVAIDASCMGNYAGSSPVLNDVVFDGNISSNKGCMANQENSNPVLTNVTFSNNIGMHGAGMYNYLSSPILTDVAFINNEARNVGGGMKNETDCDPILTNVLFYGNSAYQGGAGIANFGNSNAVLTNVAFINNTAHAAGGGGMGIIGSTITLTNVTFSGNHGLNGAGLSIWQGDLTMTNVTFSDNTADRDGAAMYNVDSTVTITNSIIWGNTPMDTQILNERAQVAITHSIVAGIAAGSGNMNRYPMLGELKDDGEFVYLYPLLPGSPAIDAGNLSICPATDQRDMPRPVDGDGDGSAICDMGAYEVQETE